MTRSTDSTGDWPRLAARLQLLPELDEGDETWLAETLADVRTRWSAGGAICLLPTKEGGWQRWVDAPHSETVGGAALAGEPRGWSQSLLADAPPAGTTDPCPARPLTGIAPDPIWDGCDWGAETRLLGVTIPLEGDRSGVLLIVAPGEEDVTLAGMPARDAHLAATEFLTELAPLLGQAIDNRARVRRLAQEVVTDELTGAYNYRYLRTALRREVRRASRFQHPLSVLMLDVDHLKEYNERFGHLRGSAVLKMMAAVLLGGTRDIDILAKYGGDEFLLILPHTEKVGAQVLADRLRRRVAEWSFPLIDQGAMTCSIGVATYPDDADQSESLVAAADAALFVAKRQGRNRVCTA